MSIDNSDLFARIAAQQRASAQAAAANPISYIPASKKDDIRKHPVLKLHAICHPIAPDSGNGLTNHWTISFDIGNGQGVMLNVQPNPQQPHSNGGSKAQVILSLLNHVVPTDAVRHEPVSILNERTVGWYVDSFASQGRFRYAFTPQGVGCRRWMRDTLEILAGAREIDSSESESARHSITIKWPDNQADEPAAGVYF